MPITDTPVLIVGGGPVGLALSIDLGWRDIASILIEQDGPDARLSHPRMDNVGIRTMEFCRRWGIARDVEHGGFPRDLPLSIVYTTGVLGHELARDVYSDKQNAKPPTFSPQKHELCPQNFFDPVLQKAAAAHPGASVRYGHRLVSFSQHDDHVEAIIEVAGTDRRETIRAGYLAACDGAGSLVAQQLGIAPEGTSLLSCSTNIFIRSPALAQGTADKRAYRYILIGTEGVWATFVNIDGRDIWRLQVLGNTAWPDWSSEQINALIRRGIGADVPYELLSWRPWSRREYVADRFRAARCFLVGDAAHQLSPTGGYGMNTGIAEAVDLSWKLAATIGGWGGDRLLDSYEAERRPIALRNVRQASENLSAMRSIPVEPNLLDDSALGEQVRQSTGSFAQRVMQREWKSFGIHLGAICRGSPLIAEEDDGGGEADIAQFVQSAAPGARAPHVWLGEDQSTLDLFGRDFVLLDFGGSTSPPAELLAAAARRSVPLKHVHLDHAEARAIYERRYVLVRPDGYVAWRGDEIDRPIELIDRVRGALPRG